MYTRQMFRRIRSVIPDQVACVGTSTNFVSTIQSTSVCNVTGYTTHTYGTNFDITIFASTGNLWILPESTSLPVAANNAILLKEGDNISFKAKSKVSIGGDSTTSKFHAIIWDI